MAVTDLDYLPRRSLTCDLARLDLALRLLGFGLRRGLRDTLLGLCAR